MPVTIRRRELIAALGGAAAVAWSLAAHAEETAKATTAQIEVARVRPADQIPSNPRLSDGLVDLTKDFSLSSTQAIGGVWEIPPYIAPADAFDERYGQW